MLTSKRALFGAALVVAAALGGCFLNWVTADEPFSKSFDVSAPPRVVVETFNGRIDVDAGAGNRVEVSGTQRGSGDTQSQAQADLANVELTLEQDGDTIRLIARYTASRSINNSGASFKVTVPAESALELKTSNGDVTIRSVAGSVVVGTSNGRITLEGGAGRMDVDTSNGAIEITATHAVVAAHTSNGRIRFGGSLTDGDHSFTTSNGDIDITLPANARFRLSASTSNGDVMTDFPITVSGTQAKGTLNGAVGENPAMSLSLGTSNGRIEVRQGK